MEAPLDEQAWAAAIAVTLAGIRAQGDQA
jgi:hypothetical protein